MRLRDLELIVKSNLSQDIDLRLYGTRTGNLYIEVYIGSKWWTGKYITEYYFRENQPSIEAITSAVEKHLQSQ